MEPLIAPLAKKYHNPQRHQCFIQNPKDLEDKKKRKQRKRKADGSQATPEKETIFISWGTETIQESALHVPNLVCARTSNSNANYTFPGTTCVEDFMIGCENRARIVNSLSWPIILKASTLISSWTSFISKVSVQSKSSTEPRS